MRLLILWMSFLTAIYSQCTSPSNRGLYIETDGSCIQVNGTFILNGETVILSNRGPVCVGGATSTVAWIAPSGISVVKGPAANINDTTVQLTCGTFVDSSSLKANLSKLFTTGSVCPNAVFTCLITEEDGSASELYVGSRLQPAIAALSVTFSTVPPSIIFNCTTSALAVTWTVNGAPVEIKSQSKLLSGVTDVRISHTLNVTTPTFGHYSCTADATLGGTSATVSVSPADVTPKALVVAIREVGATAVALQLSHPSQSPPTLLHNITYMGGCSTLARTLVTPGNSSFVNITGLGEGSVYSFSIYSVGVFHLSSPQTPTLMVQTNSTAPSSWPLALQYVGPNSTNVSLSWLELSCDSWKGLNRSYMVLYSSGGGANVTITSNTPNVTISNLKPNTAYSFRVAAVNEVGAGPYSPAITIMVGGTTPSSPTNATIQSPLPTEGGTVLIIVTSVVGGLCLVSAGIVIAMVHRYHAKKTGLQDIAFQLEPVVPNPYTQDDRPPVIEGFPESCSVSEEDCSVEIEGRVTGYPPPICEWRYNGTNLDLVSNELAHMREGGKLTLPVVESGVYLFIATNRLGSAEATIQVTVTCDSDEETDFSEDKSSTNSPSICSDKPGSMRQEKPVPLSQLQDYVVRLQANFNDGFHWQYKCLPSGAEKKAMVGQLPENRCLNRLPKIIPYDHNRVILDPMPRSNDVCNKYINASYIDGHNRHKKFIATQGPLQSTLEDFWWMVWQEGVEVMVMLCDIVERGKVMCQLYWPDETGLTYGPFLITLMGKQETHPHYIICNIKLQMLGGGAKQGRQIRHYKFTSWPEHGVPENAGPLLALRQDVMGTQTKAPILVHCNGVGRTGVFIALDCAMEQAKSEDCVDVMAIVTHLREQRMRLVQTVAQYIFIYNSLLEELACGCTRIPIHNLRSYVSTNAQSIEAQYELLLRITPEPAEVDRTTALKNADLNRSPLFLPWEKRRVVLQGIKPNYIHASYADGYGTKKAFIIAEGPMESTCDRFWHMVFQEECGLIVMLSAPKEHGRETCHIYWPSEGESYFQGLTVKFNQQTKTESQHERHFTVFPTHNPKDKLMVTHIQVLNWMSDGQCANYNGLVRMVEKLGRSTVVVHCSDTVSRSGVFCALSNVVEQAKMEGIVDVFQAVKRLRIQKPGAVQSLSQYYLIFELVRCYCTLFDSYNN